MPGIKEVIENYDKIVQLFEEQGFENVIFFKGFSAKEEHNLNIVLKDRVNLSTQTESLPTRMLHVRDQLLKLLNCNIITTTYESMLPRYQAKLNNTNSVKITSQLSEIAFSSAFGLDWQFNPAAPYQLAQVKNLPFYFKPSTSNEYKQALKQNTDLDELEEKTANYLIENLNSLSTPITTKPELEDIIKRITEKTEQKLNLKISEQKAPKAG